MRLPEVQRYQGQTRQENVSTRGYKALASSHFALANANETAARVERQVNEQGDFWRITREITGLALDTAQYARREMDASWRKGQEEANRKTQALFARFNSNDAVIAAKRDGDKEALEELFYEEVIAGAQEIRGEFNAERSGSVDQFGAELFGLDYYENPEGNIGSGESNAAKRAKVLAYYMGNEGIVAGDDISSQVSGLWNRHVSEYEAYRYEERNGIIQDQYNTIIQNESYSPEERYIQLKGIIDSYDALNPETETPISPVLRQRLIAGFVSDFGSSEAKSSIQTNIQVATDSFIEENTYRIDSNGNRLSPPEQPQFGERPPSVDNPGPAPTIESVRSQNPGIPEQYLEETFNSEKQKWDEAKAAYDQNQQEYREYNADRQLRIDEYRQSLNEYNNSGRRRLTAAQRATFTAEPDAEIISSSVDAMMANPEMVDVIEAEGEAAVRNMLTQNLYEDFREAAENDTLNNLAREQERKDAERARLNMAYANVSLVPPEQRQAYITELNKSVEALNDEFINKDIGELINGSSTQIKQAAMRVYGETRPFSVPEAYIDPGSGGGETIRVEYDNNPDTWDAVVTNAAANNQFYTESGLLDPNEIRMTTSFAGGTPMQDGEQQLYRAWWDRNKKNYITKYQYDMIDQLEGGNQVGPVLAAMTGLAGEELQNVVGMFNLALEMQNTDDGLPMDSSQYLRQLVKDAQGKKIDTYQHLIGSILNSTSAPLLSSERLANSPDIIQRMGENFLSGERALTQNIPLYRQGNTFKPLNPADAGVIPSAISMAISDKIEEAGGGISRTLLENAGGTIQDLSGVHFAKNDEDGIVYYRNSDGSISYPIKLQLRPGVSPSLTPTGVGDDVGIYLLTYHPNNEFTIQTTETNMTSSITSYGSTSMMSKPNGVLATQEVQLSTMDRSTVPNGMNLVTTAVELAQSDAKARALVYNDEVAQKDAVALQNNNSQIATRRYGVVVDEISAAFSSRELSLGDYNDTASIDTLPYVDKAYIAAQIYAGISENHSSKKVVTDLLERFSGFNRPGESKDYDTLLTYEEIPLGAILDELRRPRSSR